VLDMHTYAIAPDTMAYLRMIWIDCNNDIDKFKAMLEQWFNNSMDRATGRYKRKNQLISFILGLLLAGIFNIDTIAITKILASNQTARTQLASFAMDKYKALDPGARTSVHVTDSLLLSVASSASSDANLSKLVLGLGYGDKIPGQEKVQQAGPLVFFGWLVTALAISLGAPFWFDLLSKLIQLRGTGPKPDEQSNTPATSTQNTPSSPVNRKG